MRLLRKTIRKLILENKSKYDAVIEMICTEKIADIDYALELAEAAEIIGPYTYKEETHYDSRSHVWTFHEFDEAFAKALSDRLRENMLFGGGKGLRTKTWESGIEPNGISTSITLIETPPYE